MTTHTGRLVGHAGRRRFRPRGQVRRTATQIPWSIVIAAVVVLLFLTAFIFVCARTMAREGQSMADPAGFGDPIAQHGLNFVIKGSGVVLRGEGG